MIEASKKSTTSRAEIIDGIWLDGRCAIFHETANWLALSDIHYGYELSRKAAGGLWPDWGMEAIRERLSSLIEDYQPETLILAGDIIDSGFVQKEGNEFLGWLCKICAGDVVFIKGNHDRGPACREFDWVASHKTGEFLFHHGHQLTTGNPGDFSVEVVGHHHPSVNLHDGAGTSLRVPALVREMYQDRGERWILPAFSPWAGGGRFMVCPECESYEKWLTSPQRVFQVTD